jgi:hypothetical protein
MSYQVNNAPTRIQPVGMYNPVRGVGRPAAPQPPVNPTPQPGGGFQMPDVNVPSGVKNFFGDVWSGSVDQLKTNGKRVLNPIDTAKDAASYLNKTPKQMWHALVDPYVLEVKSGHTGRAVGKLLANVATIGGAILGGRFLFSRLGGGGASVGTSGPIGNFFSGVGNVVGAVTRPIGNVLGSIGRGIGNAIRWIIPGGGGAGVGFR